MYFVRRLCFLINGKFQNGAQANLRVEGKHWALVQIARR
jgi:hypothetical protein